MKTFKYLIFIILGILLFLLNNKERFTISGIAWAVQKPSSSSDPDSKDSWDQYDYYFNNDPLYTLTPDLIYNYFPRERTEIINDFPPNVGNYDVYRYTPNNTGRVWDGRNIIFHQFPRLQPSGGMQLTNPDLDPPFYGGFFDFNEDPRDGGMSGGGTCNTFLSCAVANLQKFVLPISLDQPDDTTLDEAISTVEEEIMNLEESIGTLTQSDAGSGNAAVSAHSDSDTSYENLDSIRIIYYFENNNNKFILYCDGTLIILDSENNTFLDTNIDNIQSIENDRNMLILTIEGNDSTITITFSDIQKLQEVKMYLKNIKGELLTKDNFIGQKFKLKLLLEINDCLLYDVDFRDVTDNDVSIIANLAKSSGDVSWDEYIEYIHSESSCNKFYILTKKINSSNTEVIISRAMMTENLYGLFLHDFSTTTRGCGYGTMLMYFLAQLRVNTNDPRSSYMKRIYDFVPADGAKKAYQHQFYLSVTKWPKLPGELFSIYDFENDKLKLIYDLSEDDSEDVGARNDGININIVYEQIKSLVSSNLNLVFAFPIHEQIRDNLKHFIMKYFNKLEHIYKSTLISKRQMSSEDMSIEQKSKFFNLLFNLDFQTNLYTEIDGNPIWNILFRHLIQYNQNSDELFQFFKVFIENYL